MLLLLGQQQPRAHQAETRVGRRPAAQVFTGQGSELLSPVCDAEYSIQGTEEQELLVQEFVDAASPAEEQAREGSKARLCHLESVGHRHGAGVWGRKSQSCLLLCLSSHC